MGYYPENHIMDFHIIIPARYGSSRFPGKPLEKIAGKAMICHVIDRARESSAASIHVATDDQRIVDMVEEYGAKAILTASDHPSGTDRLQESVSKLGLGNDDIVVNVQGDEPLISHSVIDQVAANLAKHTECSVATLGEPIESKEDLLNPNIVKVAFRDTGVALYFSRAPIPWDRDGLASTQTDYQPTEMHRRHLGIYAYRVQALNDFVGWPEGHLERLEKLEQLRFLENGQKIHIDKAVVAGTPGVDTPEDLKRVEQLILAMNQ
jgi:3-deoxy-manno-octulosonate cytidylyltransferase (CMP-KDO synthetase)